MESSSWQFAYLGFHLLLLVFIQSVLLRITSHRKLKLLLAHQSKTNYEIIEQSLNDIYMSTLPFINERTLFRLLRSSNVPVGVIDKLEEACEIRNSIAHCNYSLSINSEVSLQKQVSNIIDLMSQVSKATKPAFIRIYIKSFSWFKSIEDVNDLDIENFVEQYLISDNYMSVKDIEYIMNRKKPNLPYETMVQKYLIKYLPIEWKCV